MANLWDDIAKTVRDGVDVVVEKTEEYAKIGKIKVEMINIKRNVEKNFTELGGKVYHLVVDEDAADIAGNAEVKGIVERIKSLEADLEDKSEELELVKAKEQPAESTA